MRIRVMRLPFIHFMRVFPRTKMSISRGLPVLVLDGGCSPNFIQIPSIFLKFHEIRKYL